MTRAGVSIANSDYLRRRVLTRTAKISQRESVWTVFLAVMHVPLGLLIFNVGSLAVLHPILAVCAGLYLALNRRYRLEQVGCAIAYIVGSEVLWRMAEVPVFWESGKYFSAAIALVALVNRGHFSIPGLPAAYFASLLPGCIITLSENQFSVAQAIFSTQMSGPFFLMVACWFFSNCELDSTRLRHLFLSVLFPILSVAFTTIFITVSTENIAFTGESNLATSGGFGPNQVSSVLGLGTFLSLLSLLIFRNDLKHQIYYLAAAGLFAAQSVMTFSRGGIYNALGAIFVVILILFRRPTVLAKRLVPIVGLLIVFLALIFPLLDNFTGGSLKERFEDTETTGRTDIVASDLQLFTDHPLFGVGVGASYSMREPILERKAMTHTEFSRLLSEHGMFGVISFFLLAYMILSRYRKQRTILGRALVAGAAVWACLFMTNAAMRLAAPSFFFGLTYSTVFEYGLFRRRDRQQTIRRDKANRDLD